MTVVAVGMILTGTALKAGAIYKGYTADSSQFPWMAELVGSNNWPSCGGVLIRADVVLTAAHCFEESPPPKPYTIVLHYKSHPVRLGVRFVIEHPQFNLDGRPWSNDLALVFLTSQRPERIIAPSQAPAVGTWTTALGFGCLSKPQATYPRSTGCPQYPAANLQGLSARIASHKFCPGRDLATQLCLDGYKSDVNKGDSGGPLLWQHDGVWKLIGIASNQDTYSPDYYFSETSLGPELGWIAATEAKHPFPSPTTTTPRTTVPGTTVPATTVPGTTVPWTTVPTTTTTAPPESTVSYDCPPASNGANNAGHYVPTGYYWNEAFTAQSSTITNGTVLLGANPDGNPHVAAVGISTTLGTHTHPANWVGSPDSFQVPGWVVESWTLPSPISVTPGQTYYLTVTATNGDFTAFDNTEMPLPGEDGCFVGSVVAS